MARVLIVGCGCRGRRLAAALVAESHAVVGTTRDEQNAGLIQEAGAEAAVADPGRLGTLLPSLEGVGVLCWLLGDARGEPEAVAALHGPRLESLLEVLVDTPVRGVVYEGAGRAGRSTLERGASTLRRIAGGYRMPAEVLDHDPADHEGWLTAAQQAVDRALLGSAR